MIENILGQIIYFFDIDFSYFLIRLQKWRKSENLQKNIKHDFNLL